MFGDFFPGTGNVKDIGAAPDGEGYAVNVPLKPGLSDEGFKETFEPIIGRIMEWYKPGAVVLQLGADSLSGDRLGTLNLTMEGHAYSVEYLKSFRVPLVLLGGGGYSIKNVSKTWGVRNWGCAGSTG